MNSIYIGGNISHQVLKDTKLLFNVQANTLKQLGYKVTHSLTTISDSILDEDVVVNPTNHTEHHLVTDVSVFNRCLSIIDKSDIIIFNLTDDTNISIGSMFEMGYAYKQNKHIIILTENNSKYNHVFVKQCASYITDDFTEVVRYLEYLYK